MKTVIIAAGGTGGHINAALSLGNEFKQRNYTIIYITGKRYLDYKLFPEQETLHIDAHPLRVKNPIKIMINILRNFLVFMKLLIKVFNVSPVAIIGCGGYVCGPVLLAGYLVFKKIYVVEQNAIAGVTNKILSKISDVNFLNFKDTKGISRNVLVTGNPVRSTITYKPIKRDNDNVKVLVFGGSLGADQINKAIFKILDELPESVCIKHQVGKGNKNNIEKSNYEQFEYLDNIQKDYEWCDIVISRAGASTVSELEIVQKPALLIPYPAAVDNHQYYNAISLKSETDFYVAVIDHKKSTSEIASELVLEINKIIAEKLFFPKKVAVIKNATIKIVDEIENNVRTR